MTHKKKKCMKANFKMLLNSANAWLKLRIFFKIQWATAISSGPLMAKFMLWIIMGSGGKGVLPGEI